MDKLKWTGFVMMILGVCMIILSILFYGMSLARDVTVSGGFFLYVIGLGCLCY